MSHVHEGPLATYNSLTDPNLAGFFGNTRMRRHLKKSGLVNRRGEIISENQYRLNMARKEHKKHVKDLLAQAIVHKTLDLERYRQVEIKKKLEEIAKIEMVRRVRASRGRKGDEEVLPYLSPRSHSRPQSSKPSEASSSRRRPKSAPSHPRSRHHMQKSGYNDPYDEVIYVDDDGRPVSPPPPSDRQSFKDSLKDVRPENIDTRHLYALDSEALQQYALRLSRAERGRDGASSPYLISQYPHPPKRERARSAKSPRRSRMSARPDSSRKHGVHHEVESPHEGALMLHRQEPAMMHQGEVQTLCEITMKYHGPNLTLPRDQYDPTQEVSIEQQHCGGNTLPVFKERLQAGSMFSFISRRHRGYPFSLTLYIDGRVDCRVSTCCEYKHGVGVKLGGKMGHFSLTGITGATPCYKCKLSCQAPPRSLKLKKGPPRKKKQDTGEEVTVEGTPRTPITPKKEEKDVSGKSDEDNYDDDFEEEDSKGNKYDDDFEDDTEERDRRHIIGLRDDEHRVNGKTVTVDVTEKEKEQEREGTLPPHRRIEGYSSEDEDNEGPRSKSIEVTADVHAQKKEESPARRRRSTSSSSSSSRSSSSEREITPRGKSPTQRVRSPSPEPKKVIAPSPSKVVSRRSESPIPITDRTDRSTTSTTSGSLTTETESTLESNRKEEQVTLVKKRRTSSSSSSSTLTSDSEDEKYHRKKREEKLRLESERRRKEDEERSRKEAEEREKERKKKLEEEEKKRQEEEEARKKRFEIQRQESQLRLQKMEEERKQAELERQKKLDEQNKAREEERLRRLAEEQRMHKDYERQLSLIQSQRESESTLSVSDTVTSEEPPKPKPEQVKVEQRPKSTSSSSSSSSESSDSESEADKKKTVTKTTSPFAQAVAAVESKEPAVQQKPKPSASSSSSTTTGTSSTSSMSDAEKEKTPAVQQMKTITEENKKERRSSSSSISSSTSSSSGGEYMVKDTKPQAKKDDQIQAIIDYKKPESDQPKFTPKPPSTPAPAVVKKKSSSSSGSTGSSSSSSSETDSDNDNKKVTSPSKSQAEVKIEKAEEKKVETKAPVPPSPQKPAVERKSSTSSTTSTSSSSETSSDKPFTPLAKPTELAPFGGIKREDTFEKAEYTVEKKKLEHEPPMKSAAMEEEITPMKEESEDSSSDSSSSSTSSTDSESDSDSEAQKPKDKQGSKPATSESEPENMHGGHDPDNVADGTSGSHVAESQVRQPKVHFGSILPMIKGDNAVDLSGVKLDENQLTEICNYVAEVDHLKGVTLRNCALNDSSFENIARSLQVTQSCPNLLNFSLNQLGAKSMTPLSVAIKTKPSIEIVILNGNPIGNVGCKVLMDSLVKTKDPFPFLRRSSGYLTPSEARHQKEEGKDVNYDEEPSSMECNIKELDLGDTKISDAAVAEISRFLELNKTLVSLNLNGNREISPSGWERLGQALKKNNTLKTLSLDLTNIGDQGLENLNKGLRTNTGLRCLELQNAGLTEKGGQLLVDLLKANTSILEITVSPGNNISDEVLEEIRKYLSLNHTVWPMS